MTSDGGFGSISLPGRAAANQALGRGGTALQILNLPDTLNNVSQPVRIPGEITQVNTNGSIRIATPEGNIDAQVRNTNNLQTGQPISIDLPAGRPPQQATLRPPTAPVQTQNDTPNTAAQNQNATISVERVAPSQQAQATTAASAQTRDATPRPEQSFLTPNNARATQAETLRAPPQVQAPAPLQTDAVIRLIAVPPNQAQRIATEFIQTLNIQSTAITSAPLTANISIQNAQAQSQTLNSALPIQAPQNLQNNLQPLLNNTAIQTPPSSSTVNIITPQIQTTQSATNLIQSAVIPTLSNPATPLAVNALTTADIAAPLIQNLSVASQTPQSVGQNLLQAGQAPIQNTIQNLFPQPVQASLIPTQITFDPTNPAPVQNTVLSRIDIQIIAIQPPQVNLTTTPLTGQQSQQIIPASTNFTPPIVNTNNNAVTITAQVTGFTAQGLPLVTLPPIGGRTIPQSYVLQFNSNNLQLGSQLQITTQNPVLAGQTQTAQPLNPLLRGFQWPALNQLYSTLFQLSPQAAASLAQTLPTPANPAQSVASAMMFIAAVKSGDITQFLGQSKADMIQRAGRENILRALSQDSGAQAARSADAGPTSEWRAVPLPMFWENEIHKITLYTRHENEKSEQDEKDGNSQTRFVFDLDLTRMGEMQIDGYLKDNRLDLIVRAQNMFSNPMQQAMREAYTNALDQTTLKGELNFQGTTKNWVHVLEQNEQLGVDV